MEVITCFSILIVIVSLFFYFRKTSGTLPPSPKGNFPIIGHFFVLWKGADEMFRLSQVYGGTFLLQVYKYRIILFSTYEDIKEAFINKVDNFEIKVQARDAFVRKIHMTSFNFISGPVWKEKRRFTMQHLRNFGFGKSVMETAIIEEFDRLSVELDKHVGQKLDINHVLFLPYLNIIWSIVAGRTYSYDDDNMLRLSHALHDIFTNGSFAIPVFLIPMLQYLPGDPFCYWTYVHGAKIEKEFVEEAIDEHVKTLKYDAEPRDYIDAYLLEMKKHEATQLTSETKCYQRKHLVGGIIDILQGGTHTITTATRWSLLYMAVWPEIQAKVQHELDNVIGISRKPVYSDHLLLPYSRATLLEILRFSTVARTTQFRYASRTTQIGSYTIPEGSYAQMNFVAVHFNKKYWGDPEVFRPERFIDEDGKFQPSDNVLPFGIGPRVCLGESLARMELFLIFISLLRRYSFHCATGEPLPSLEPLNETARHPRPFELILKLR